jgi:hypothetical protein
LNMSSAVTSDLTLDASVQQSKTYQIANDKIEGFIEKITALEQSIYHMLNVEQYEFPIYSLDYGFKVTDLIGKDQIYVKTELQRRIKEVLLTDSRISSVGNFEFTATGDSMLCTFDVTSIYGTTTATTEVTI